MRCAEYLETAKFVEFWEVANLGGNELLDEVPGFDEAIRSYMIGVLSITFQKLEVRNGSPFGEGYQMSLQCRV